MVTSVDEGFYVVHTAIAYFEGVSVDDFVEFVGLRGMFVNQVKKKASDVGGSVSTAGWVIPGNVATSVTLWAVRLVIVTVGLWGIGEMCVEVAVS